jgi:RHS repeat-associated protein
MGSVRQVANASGMVGDPCAFDPFGNPIGSSGNNPSHYGYAGEWTDGTGLQYLRARYYSPAQGRFITQDPFPGYLNQPSTLNPYTYVTNDPATLTDPSGKNPFLIAAGLGGLIGAGIDVGVQLFAMRPSSLGQALRCLNWGQVGVSFGAGAIAGLTGFTVFGGMTALLGTGLMANVASGAVAGILAGQYARLTALVLSGQTDQIRSTLFRSQDLALDAVIGGAVAGATYGITNLLGRIRSSLTARSVNVPNPNGRLGGSAHQAVIQDLENQINVQGFLSKTEFKVETPGGLKPYRYIDIAALDVDKNPIAFYQVGKATKNYLPIARERQALADIIELGGYDIPRIFVPYW